MSRQTAATVGLLVPAALALTMSADTSYRFMETALQITDENERMALCGVAEAAIIALTVYSWATRTKGPAYLAYAAVLVQALPAFTVSGSVGGPVRVVLGPVLLAVLLHLLLGLELRMSGEKSTGILASALREMRERLVAFLGIGRRGADSAAIARSRAADRAVDLADRLEGAEPGKRRHTRLTAKLAAQIDAARHGLDADEAAAAEAAIVARVVRRKSVKSLANIKSRHDWTLSLVPAEGGARDKGHSDVPGDMSPAPVVPVSPVPQDGVPAAVSPAPVVPARVPAVVSRPRSAVPAVSPSRPSVHVSLDKVSESVPADRDMSRDSARYEVKSFGDITAEARGESPDTGQAVVDVPEDRLGSVASVVRFLTETGHSRDEIRRIVPTLPLEKPAGEEALKKAIQRCGPKA
ncbi:hypothetical protein [Streptomyces africanus]|uniref:hypothetical protein n=1 Tax=Streptomyces africanus TaxID=231024 RepID=UPI00117FE901|nr:hypothetical protein [Streptomyces africanus]